MTRETKIGLLVGLAFIIVIGILLSDHLTSTNEPIQAPLAQAGGNVRSAVTVPGAGTAPLASNTTPPTQHVAPQQPVPTKEELTPKQPPVEIVQIGGGAAPQHSKASNPPSQRTSRTQVAQNDSNDDQNLSAEQGVTGVDSNSSPTPRQIDSKASGSIAKVAQNYGEEIVPADGKQRSSQNAGNANATSNGAQLAAGGTQYKAEPGDNLAKIANKTLHNSSKATINAIIAANPSLQQNPNLIIAGRTYVIPGATSSSSTSSASSQSPTPSISTQSQPQQIVQNSSADAAYVYTVKPGDSLTRIAVTQLGNADAVEAIKDLNKDALKGGDVIRPNMKLRLPSKPVASAT